MLKLKFFWLLILFLALCFFPYYRQTKKNLLCLIFIFIVSCGFMIADLGLEFLPFSYLLIYVGAVAVMFLFIIVAVDPFYETQKMTYEDSIFVAGLTSNILISFFYFLFSFYGGDFSNVLGMSNIKYYSFSSEKVNSLIADSNNYSFVFDKRYNLQFYETVCGGSSESLSLYSFLEYKLKDLSVFSDYFFNFHSFLLVVTGFVLTTSMLISFVISKDFASK